jgi:hypothetical protein
MMDKYRVASVLLAGFAIAACANGQMEENETMSDEDKKPGVSDLTVVSAPTVAGDVETGPGAREKGNIGPGLQRLVDKAVEDLMLKAGVEKDAIEVLQADFVTWGDSSMGCPKPGYQYLQVLTNGSRIVLRTDNKTYHYHSGKNYPPFHCENPSKIKPSPYAPGEA